jgi:hypothetical protein
MRLLRVHPACDEVIAYAVKTTKMAILSGMVKESSVEGWRNLPVKTASFRHEYDAVRLISKGPAPLIRRGRPLCRDKILLFD